LGIFSNGRDFSLELKEITVSDVLSLQAWSESDIPTEAGIRVTADSTHTSLVNIPPFNHYNGKFNKLRHNCTLIPTNHRWLSSHTNGNIHADEKDRKGEETWYLEQVNDGTGAHYALKNYRTKTYLHYHKYEDDGANTVSCRENKVNLGNNG
jgi:hypothetical protein